MTESFVCPNCGASLSYNHEDQGSTVKCDFCGSTVIVPESIRRGSALPGISSEEKIKSYPAETTGVNRSRVIGCILLLILVVFILPTLAAIIFGVVGRDSQTIEGTGSEPSGQQIRDEISGSVQDLLEPAVKLQDEEGFATVALEFGGEEGTGPGFFNDTRSIAVDGEGRIYTGDYSGGRIQVFDSEGKFLNLWFTGDDRYISSLAASRDGILYVLQSDGINSYDGLTGQHLGLFVNSSWPRFDALAVAPDGTVIAAGDPDLASYDPQGNSLLDLPEALSQLEFGGVTRAVDLDGSGSIYVAHGDYIYRYNSQGKYIDRLGSPGQEADQFETSPTALAIDGKDRLFVEDFDGIKVFDGDGRYQGIIDHRGVTFQMVFNDQNELLVMERNGNRVLKYTLNQ